VKLGVHEILQMASDQKRQKDKIDMLRAKANDVVLKVLRGAYDPRVKWHLPEGKVPYKPSRMYDTQGMLYSEARRFYLFQEDPLDQLDDLKRITQYNLSKDMRGRMKREALFVQFLEALDPDDAHLMMYVKDKKLPYKGLNRAVVRQAFPGLFADKDDADGKETAAAADGGDTELFDEFEGDADSGPDQQALSGAGEGVDLRKKVQAPPPETFEIGGDIPWVQANAPGATEGVIPAGPDPLPDDLTDAGDTPFVIDRIPG